MPLSYVFYLQQKHVTIFVVSLYQDESSHTKATYSFHVDYDETLLRDTPFSYQSDHGGKFRGNAE